MSQASDHTQKGGFETRVAARSRVPAAVLGIREGMQGSALNAGNYGATRRMWADGWFSPTVDGLCEAFERIFRLQLVLRNGHAG